MEIAVNTRDKSLIISLTGRIDFNSRNELKNIIENYLKKGV